MTVRDNPLVPALLARCPALRHGESVTCAVSGGAALVALLILATGAGCSVDVIHVDHGLRPDSSRDADFVATLAARFGASFRSVKVQVEGPGNVEARARHRRWGALGPTA